MRKRRVELDKEREEKKQRVRDLNVNDKGKRKADAIDIDDPEPELESKAQGPMEQKQTYPTDRVTRASVLRARRVTGRSVGIDAIEEMIAFEQRGVELGELPVDFSFEK